MEQYLIPILVVLSVLVLIAIFLLIRVLKSGQSHTNEGMLETQYDLPAVEHTQSMPAVENYAGNAHELIAAGKPQEAISMLNMAISAEPNRVDHRLSLLKLLADENNVDQFEQAVDELHMLNDSSAVAYANQLRSTMTPSANELPVDDMMKHVTQPELPQTSAAAPSLPSLDDELNGLDLSLDAPVEAENTINPTRTEVSLDDATTEVPQVDFDFEPTVEDQLDALEREVTEANLTALTDSGIQDATATDDEGMGFDFSPEPKAPQAATSNDSQLSELDLDSPLEFDTAQSNDLPELDLDSPLEFDTNTPSQSAAAAELNTASDDMLGFDLALNEENLAPTAPTATEAASEFAFDVDEFTADSAASVDQEINDVLKKGSYSESSASLESLDDTGSFNFDELRDLDDATDIALQLDDANDIPALDTPTPALNDPSPHASPQLAESTLDFTDLEQSSTPVASPSNDDLGFDFEEATQPTARDTDLLDLNENTAPAEDVLTFDTLDDNAASLDEPEINQPTINEPAINDLALSLDTLEPEVQAATSIESPAELKPHAEPQLDFPMDDRAALKPAAISSVIPESESPNDTIAQLDAIFMDDLAAESQKQAAPDMTASLTEPAALPNADPVLSEPLSLDDSHLTPDATVDFTADEPLSASVTPDALSLNATDLASPSDTLDFTAPEITSSVQEPAALSLETTESLETAESLNTTELTLEDDTLDFTAPEPSQTDAEKSSVETNMTEAASVAASLALASTAAIATTSQPVQSSPLELDTSPVEPTDTPALDVALEDELNLSLADTTPATHDDLARSLSTDDVSAEAALSSAIPAMPDDDVMNQLDALAAQDSNDLLDAAEATPVSIDEPTVPLSDDAALLSTDEIATHENELTLTTQHSETPAELAGNTVEPTATDTTNDLAPVSEPDVISPVDAFLQKAEAAEAELNTSPEVADEPTQPVVVETEQGGELLAQLQTQFAFVEHYDIYQTNLDLANRYVDLGEYSNARSLLNEVVHSGNIEQQGEAKQLLEKLAS